jgi:gliding motility-associated-like protein
MITKTLGGDCAEVRTILSPNGDNSNETFEISCARLLSVDLEIFNRWGQKVYEMVDYDNEWRGTDNDGNPLPGDGYFYILKFTDPEDGSDRQVKGYVTIIREE